MIIRRMTEADLDTITKLEQQLFNDPWSRNSFEYEVKRNPFSIPLVLEDKKTILGYSIVWKIYEEFHIANLAISLKYQGKKKGAYLLDQVLNLADESSYVLLEVRESNERAIRLYEKFGFKTIMKRYHYYRNGETALVMQKIIRKNGM